MKENRAIRVYTLHERYRGRRVWACHKPTGARTSLGYRYDLGDGTYYERVDPIRLHGSIVGWMSKESDRESDWYSVRSKDLATGQVLNFHTPRSGGDACPKCWYGWVGYDFTMDRAGSLAWTSEGYGEGPSAKRVMKSDNWRGGVVIDAGPKIDLGSLRRDGRTISWMHGEETRTFRLAR